MQTYYDVTGQVYIEATAPAESMVASLMNNFTGRREDPKSHVNRRGAARLCDMAIRTCAWNIYDPGMPETLPCFLNEYQVMRRIFLHLKEIDTLTFKAWKVFHDAFKDDFKDDCRVSIFKQYGGLDKIDVIYNQIRSVSSTTLTFLCVQNLTLNSLNLNTHLLKFSNLGVLILQSASRSPLDELEDRMIKSWGLSVKSTAAFQKLTTLTLTHFNISILGALEGLAGFPALKLCRLESPHVPAALLDAYSRGRDWRHPDGNWHQRLTNRDRRSESNPETIFGRGDLTTHTRMEMLYDISASYAKVPTADVDHIPVVSIVYGNTAPNLSALSYSAWFVRIHPSEEENGRVAAKRGPDQKSKAPDKRRKMRGGRGMDIGSMLNDFVR